MKRVLYISDFLLEKNIGAHKLTVAHLRTLEEIVGIDNVDIIVLTGNRVCENEHYEAYRGYSNKFEKIINLVQLNNPLISNKIINKIINKIESKKYDVVFIDNSYYGMLVKKIKKEFKNIKIITFYHDIKRNLCKQWLKKLGIKYLPDYLTIVYNEYLNVKYCDTNITLNKRESKDFEKYYKKTPDLELPIYFKENENIKNIEINKQEVNILFVGAYYYPNVNGIKWFCENVIPELNHKCKLYIVGKGMDKLRNELQNSKVEVVGAIEDLSYYYNLADIVVAPIFEGAGMKVKTAEAFMFGKSFVGTEESLVGYLESIDDEILNKYIFKADTKDEYIKAINYLSKNREAIKCNLKIRELYKENYSDIRALKNLEKFI